MELETEIKPTYTAGIFIDYENLLISFTNGYNIDPVEAQARTIKSIVSTMQYLRSHNIKISVNEAFADWRGYKSAARALAKQGVKTIQVYALPRKSSADIEMSLRIFDTMVFNQEHLDVYAILGGDRDYLPILRRIVAYGRGAMVVGLEKSMSHWVVKEVGLSNAVFIDSHTGELDFKNRNFSQ